MTWSWEATTVVAIFFRATSHTFTLSCPVEPVAQSGWGLGFVQISVFSSQWLCAGVRVRNWCYIVGFCLWWARNNYNEPKWNFYIIQLTLRSELNLKGSPDLDLWHQLEGPKISCGGGAFLTTVTKSNFLLTSRKHLLIAQSAVILADEGKHIGLHSKFFWREIT